MELLKEYRKKREMAVQMYAQEFGEYINTVCDTPLGTCWKWLEGPWPWENNFMEDK